jgi:DNA-binding NtrC family response regulator
MAAVETYHIVVLDLILGEGSVFAVADFMNYRQPDAQVIFVTNTSFFLRRINLSIVFQCLRMCSKRATPDDLAAIIEHYAANRQTDSRP